MYRNYNILFSISIKHEFSSESLSRVFSLIPTQECRELLRRYGLIFKKFEDKYFIFYRRNSEAKSELGEVINRIEEEVRFSFVLKLIQAELYNISNLGDYSLYSQGRNVLALSNLTASSGNLDEHENNSGVHLLTVSDLVGPDDFFQIATKSFRVPFNGTEVEKVIIQRAGIGNPPVDVFEQLIDPEQESLVLNFQGYQEGRYYLKLIPRGGASIQETFKLLLNSNNPAENAFGYIEIYKDATVNYDEAINYQIKFGTRREQWKYFIIVADDNDQSTYQITYKKSNNTNSNLYPDSISFNLIQPEDYSSMDKETVDSFNPKRVVVFQSEENIPLFEEPLGGISLEKEEGGIFRLVSKHLPNPGSKNLNREIFINL